MIYLIQQSNDSTVHELAILLLEIARIINCLTRRLVTELPPRFSLLLLGLRSCGMWVALTQPCPCHSWHVCKYPLNMKTPVPKLRQAANDNEKEHETANCITYSYAAAAAQHTHVFPLGSALALGAHMQRRRRRRWRRRWKHPFWLRR